MLVYKCFLLFLAAFCVSDLVKCVNVKDKDGKKNGKKEDGTVTGVFRPTREWQPLPKDMAVPRGLHIRLNLETGRREAKLIDPDEESDDNFEMTSLALQEDGDNPPLTSSVSPQELKYILHKMELNEPILPEEDAASVKAKYRPYEELRRELYAMNADIKTDVELMEDLMASYRELTVKPEEEPNDLEQELLTILTDLEYLVHQIDNAKEFVKTGLKDIVFPALNSTSGAIRYEATKLLGSAVQSNPAAQVAALQQGAINVLLRSLAFDPLPQVKSGVLFALSCLVRKFPAAQAILVERGGLAVLTNLFNSDSNLQTKLQNKVMTLMNDLIIERRDAEAYAEELGNSTTEESAEARERVRQYRRTGLEQRLEAEGWCTLLRRLLVGQDAVLTDSAARLEDLRGVDDAALRADHHTVEALVSVMSRLVELCREPFEADLALAEFLGALAPWYLRLSQREQDDTGYFTLLSQQVSSLHRAITQSSKLKDEL